jgi:hypothetical protein
MILMRFVLFRACKVGLPPSTLIIVDYLFENRFALELRIKHLDLLRAMKITRAVPFFSCAKNDDFELFLALALIEVLTLGVSQKYEPDRVLHAFLSTNILVVLQYHLLTQVGSIFARSPLLPFRWQRHKKLLALFRFCTRK